MSYNDEWFLTDFDKWGSSGLGGFIWTWYILVKLYNKDKAKNGTHS